MKRATTVLALATCLVAAGLQGLPTQAAQPAAQSSDKAKLSYGVGLYLGREIREGLKADGIEADLDLLVEGFADGLMDRTPDMDEEELEGILHAVHREMQARMVRRRLAEDPAFKRLHDTNLARSRAYHERHQYDEGVVTLDSGVQYKVLESGRGPKPTIDDVVVVNYRVERIDGTLIDEGEGAVIEVDSISEGGIEILQMMSVGDKWHVAVPPHRAYGAGGDPPRIGPHQTLIAVVELLEIKERDR
jgi:FKBP-type peptidyl-prolyl cis-trans isomerase FklB